MANENDFQPCGLHVSADRKRTASQWNGSAFQDAGGLPNAAVANQDFNTFLYVSTFVQGLLAELVADLTDQGLTFGMDPDAAKAQIAKMLAVAGSAGFVAPAAPGVPKLIQFYSSGTYTPSTGARLSIVRGVGGGGSGSAVHTNAFYIATGNGYGYFQSCVGSGGGAGGGFLLFLPSSLLAGGVAVTIGAGGASPSPTAVANGNTGGLTKFGTFASANGGGGGNLSGQSGYQRSAGLGGPGGSASINLPPGASGRAWRGECGANGNTIDAGSGGSTMFGGGGQGGGDIGNGGDGVSGGLGAGGGGADYSTYGGGGAVGAGGNGFVEIQEIF